MHEFLELLKNAKRGSPYSETDAIVDILIAEYEGEKISDRKIAECMKCGRSHAATLIKKVRNRATTEPLPSHYRAIDIQKNQGFEGCDRATTEPLPSHYRAIKPIISQSCDTEICKHIVDYFNSKCNTKYRYDNEDMQRLIPERLNEGFTENDFYTVIDKKVDEWTGTKWEQYLRPYTLFRKDKFEGYLNQRAQRSKSTGNAYIDAIMNRIDIVDTWMED